MLILKEPMHLLAYLIIIIMLEHFEINSFADATLITNPRHQPEDIAIIVGFAINKFIEEYIINTIIVLNCYYSSMVDIASYSYSQHY